MTSLRRTDCTPPSKRFLLFPPLLSLSHQNPYNNYQLVIVGHSLGAAAAAILALTLRHQYPTLQCLGYGMPASVFDWTTAQGAEYLLCLRSARTVSSPYLNSSPLFSSAPSFSSLPTFPSRHFPLSLITDLFLITRSQSAASM